MLAETVRRSVTDSVRTSPPHQIGIAGVLLLGAFVLASFLTPDLQWKEFLLSAGLACEIVYVITTARQPMLLANPIFLLPFVYLITFPIQGLLHDVGITHYSLESHPGDDDYRRLAIHLVGLATLSFVTAFRIRFNAKCKPEVRVTKRNQNEEALTFRIATCMLLLGWVIGHAGTIAMNGAIGTEYMPEKSLADHDSSAVMVLDLAIRLGFVGLLWTCLRSSIGFRPTVMLKILLCTGLAFEGLALMGAGAKINIVRLGLIFVIVAERKRWEKGGSRASLATYGCMGAVIVVSFSIIASYRELALADPAWMTSSSITESVKMQIRYFGEASKTAFSNETSTSEREAQIGNRLSNLSSLMRVLSFLQGKSDYEGLADAALLPLYAIVPRTFLPTKAVYIGSGGFAALNGWKFGGLSLTLIGSLFWVAGSPGVCVGFVLFGLCAGHYWAGSLQRSQSAYVCFGMCALMNLTLWDTTWAAMATSLIRWRIALGAVLLVSNMVASVRHRYHEPALHHYNVPTC